MRKKYFTLIFAFSLLSLSLASPSFAEEIPGIDNRVTSAKSFIDSKQYFNFAPSPPGDSSLPPKCGFARFNIPGALEKEEAEVLAGEGKYLLAAEKMSEAIDFYDKCGKLKGPEKVPPRMMISKEPLDRNWLAMRAYFYQKCGKKDLAIADFERLIDYDPYRNRKATFTAVVELIRYKEYGLAAYSLRHTGWGDPNCHYLLGHCQEKQSKPFDALYNYNEAAQLFYINGEKEAMQASLKKVRALCPANDPRKNIQESDLAPRRKNIDKKIELLKYLITSENCFDATKLDELIGTTPEEKLQMSVTSRSISSNVPNLLCIAINEKHCTIFKSDLAQWLVGKTPLPQAKINTSLYRKVYEIPSGYLALKWHHDKFKELESLEVSSKNADPGWDPKEYIEKSELIEIGEFKGLVPASKSRYTNNFPTAYFHPVGTLKGAPLSATFPVRYPPDDSPQPMRGSLWIIFVENAVPVDRAFETLLGAKGRVRFTQANLMLLHKEMERRKLGR